MQSPRSKNQSDKVSSLRKAMNSKPIRSLTSNIPSGSTEQMAVATGEHKPVFNVSANRDEARNGSNLRQQEHTFSNGDYLVGLHNGRFIEGYGFYTFTSQGLQYRGHFKQSKQHGEGSLYMLSQDGQQGQLIYEGEWMNGMKQGHGTYHYFKDTLYNGDWFQNKKEGHGIFRSPDGEYRGQWKDDKKHGDGTLMLKSGVTMNGKWSNDQL